MSVRLEVVGREDVGGVQTDHVLFTMTPSNGQAVRMEMWVNEKGEILRMIVNGEELPAQVAAMGGTSMLIGFFWPFVTADAMDFAAALEGENSASLFYANKVETRTERFGDVPAEVYSFTVQMRDAAKAFTYTWEVADFGKFQLFTRWQFNQPGPDGGTAEFRVTDLKLRFPGETP